MIRGSFFSMQFFFNVSRLSFAKLILIPMELPKLARPMRPSNRHPTAH